MNERGRSIWFYNQSMSGGFQAIHADSGEERAGYECWIDDVRCWAGEAHTSGIVVYPL